MIIGEYSVLELEVEYKQGYVFNFETLLDVKVVTRRLDMDAGRLGIKSLLFLLSSSFCFISAEIQLTVTAATLLCLQAA